jgi:hypothetical protein
MGAARMLAAVFGGGGIDCHAANQICESHSTEPAVFLALLEASKVRSGLRRSSSTTPEGSGHAE